MNPVRSRTAPPLGRRLAAAAAMLSGAVRGWRARLGREGAAAMLLALAAAGLVPLSILPSMKAIEAARQQLRTARPVVRMPAAPRPGDALATLQVALDSERRFPDRLAALIQHAADQGLQINDGAYAVTREAHGRIVCYQVNLPLRGNYPQLRRFVDAVLRDERAVALQDVQFKRAKVGDPLLEAAIRLDYFMGPAS
jgi:hypothetical protein